MKKLPLGIQELSVLMENDCIYVDKTQHIYNLISAGKYYFLSRPRRFGKSLLINTMKELFLGNRDYFTGLWVENKWDWNNTTPVIRISFTEIGHKTVGLEQALLLKVNNIAEEMGIELSLPGYSLRFNELIKKASAKGPVAILIDEYDKAIIDVIEDTEKAKENRDILKTFFSPIKDLDAHIRFLFITGVSKFSQVSIFSELNNLTDITIDGNYSTICGYTQSELENSFQPYILELKEKQKEIYPDILGEIKKWYNGYSWDAENYVYNPFSILSLFFKMNFHNFWFQTGTPTFLLKIIRQSKVSAFDIENTLVSSDSFNTFDIERLEVNSILFQTGYLTIKEYDKQRRTYKLDYPNFEVEASLSANILAEFAETRPERNSTLLFKMADCFTAGQPEKFVELCSGLLKGLAYPLVEKKEAYFHSIFYLIMKMIGFDINCEVINIDGRIDAVVLTEKIIYIIEFKLDSPQAAMKQIHEKGYHKSYLSDGRKIVLLGIGFDAEKREIAGFELEEAK